MKQRLTDETIATIDVAPPAKRLEVFDTVLPGLVLRVTERGIKSFAVRYRHQGKTLRCTIGKTPPLKLKKAREIGYGLLAAAREGLNPMAEKRAAQKAKDTSPPCEKVVERFIEKGLSGAKPDHAKEVARLLRKEVANRWKGRTLASVEAADVAKLLEGISAPSTQRHAYYALRLLFKWSKGVGIISASPIGKDFPNPSKPRSRERVLETEELKAIWTTVIGTYSTFNAIVQLLLVTGQRRDEVAEAMWKEFDFSKNVWTIPAHRTKTGDKPHRLPLTDLMIQILNNIPRGASTYVFPGQGAKRGTFSGWSRSKRRLDEKCHISDWRLHDLRRTMSTRLAEKGVAPHVVERIINHRDGQVSGVAAIYNRATYEKEMLEALERWSRHLENLYRSTMWVLKDTPQNRAALEMLGPLAESNGMEKPSRRIRIAPPNDCATSKREYSSSL
ncbi:tyrosine-type recombinase/integrase [Hyphomicrobium facile]|uniref:Site-specific recombinase XerD n=1 Tax=Hyphomicrobium facile TaxID=51670 RepID=A0A1I7NE20_9HYPH|nr:site-specific integrase [Hyphomicrobium facile]SFV32902.1 Site-specific recombinase XerD [Hyphomicrobium facile]